MTSPTRAHTFCVRISPHSRLCFFPASNISSHPSDSHNTDAPAYVYMYVPARHRHRHCLHLLLSTTSPISLARAYLNNSPARYRHSVVPPTHHHHPKHFLLFVLCSPSIFTYSRPLCLPACRPLSPRGTPHPHVEASIREAWTWTWSLEPHRPTWDSATHRSSAVCVIWTDMD